MSIQNTMRDVENLPGVVFDPLNKKRFFAEDWNGLKSLINDIIAGLGGGSSSYSETVTIINCNDSVVSHDGLLNETAFFSNNNNSIYNFPAPVLGGKVRIACSKYAGDFANCVSLISPAGLIYGKGNAPITNLFSVLGGAQGARSGCEFISDGENWYKSS